MPLLPKFRPSYRQARRSMLHLLSPIICLVALVGPGLSAASYRIELRNGRHVTTSQYWKEGHSLMFSTTGGVGGVPESAVLRIQTVEDISESDLVGAAEQKVPPQAEVQRDGEKMFTRDLEAYQHKKEEIQSQLNTALERYREASGPQHKEEKAKIQQEMTAWSKQLFDLRDKVKQKYQGRLPEEWENF